MNFNPLLHFAMCEICQRDEILNERVSEYHLETYEPHAIDKRNEISRIITSVHQAQMELARLVSVNDMRILSN